MTDNIRTKVNMKKTFLDYFLETIFKENISMPINYDSIEKALLTPTFLCHYTPCPDYTAYNKLGDNMLYINENIRFGIGNGEITNTRWDVMPIDCTNPSYVHKDLSRIFEIKSIVQNTSHTGPRVISHYLARNNEEKEYDNVYFGKYYFIESLNNAFENIQQCIISKGDFVMYDINKIHKSNKIILNAFTSAHQKNRDTDFEIIHKLYPVHILTTVILKEYYNAIFEHHKKNLEHGENYG